MTDTDDLVAPDDPVVVLDGETGQELLVEGETTAWIYEGDADGAVDHREVGVVNIAGPHPLFARETIHGSPLDRYDIAKILGAITFANASMLAVVHVLQPTIATGAGTVTMTATEPGVWIAIALSYVVAVAVLLGPRLPDLLRRATT